MKAQPTKGEELYVAALESNAPFDELGLVRCVFLQLADKRYTSKAVGTLKKKKKKKNRDRQTETERQRDRQSDRDRVTERERDRQREKNMYILV